MDNVFHIVYILNDAYWVPVLVSAYSALKHTKCGKIIFHLIVDGVSAEHRSAMRSKLSGNSAEVVFHEADMSLFVDLPDWHGSKLVWTRCALCEILPDVYGWVCICDGDTLWFKGAEELMQEIERMSPSTIIAASHRNIEDWFGEIPRLKKVGVALNAEDTFCLGFAVIHLDRMRAFNSGEKVQEYLEKYGVTRLLEQDVFNWIYRNNKAILSYGWGAFSARGNLKKLSSGDIGLVHYVCDLPWIQTWRNGLSPVKKAWWKVAEELGVLSCDSRYKKRRLTFMLMMLISRIYRILPLFLRKRIQGEF